MKPEVCPFDLTSLIPTLVIVTPTYPMCRVYNTIGALTSIKAHLLQSNVEGFNSVQELLRFQKNYATVREQLISIQKTLLTEERKNLTSGVLELENEIEKDKEELQLQYNAKVDALRSDYDKLAGADKTLIQEFTFSFKALFKLIRITYIQAFSRRLICRSVKPKVALLSEKHKRLYYLTSHFEAAVTESCGLALHELDRKKRVIDEINTFIYGAIGEQKVVDELKQLSDDYILINDFSFEFYKPLYYKPQRTQIKTIQLDHVLVSPAGVFLIETKNWSKESVQSLNLRSPVEQIKRINFALYVLLKNSSGFKLGKHHWGERKVPIRNLIVLMNNKPREEFEYVKILNLGELVGYIKFFKPVVSSQETQEIAEYLLKKQ